MCHRMNMEKTVIPYCTNSTLGSLDKLVAKIKIGQTKYLFYSKSKNLRTTT